MCLTLAFWVQFSGVACALNGMDRQGLQKSQARVQDQSLQSKAKPGYSLLDRMRVYFSNIAAETIVRDSVMLSGSSQGKSTGPLYTASDTYYLGMSEPYYESRASLFSLPLQDRVLRIILYSLRQKSSFPPSGAPPHTTGQVSLGSEQSSIMGMSYSLVLDQPFQMEGGLLHASQAQGEGGQGYQTWRADMGLTYNADPAIGRVWGTFALSDPNRDGEADSLHPLREARRDSFDSAFSLDGGLDGGVPGGYSLARELVQSKTRGNSPPKMWQLGLGVRGIHYLDRWESSFGLAYGRGLYDSDLPEKYRKGLSRRDSYIEARMEHRYQAYENLAAVLELGYASLDLDSKRWGEDQEENGYLMNIKYDLSF